jgi:hypothetical protein
MLLDNNFWLRMELYKQAVFVKDLIYRIEAKEIYDKYIRDEKATKNAK